MSVTVQRILLGVLLCAALVAAPRPAAAAQSQPAATQAASHEGGEASLVLPDLSTASVQRNSPNSAEVALKVIADPNIAFLLFIVGIIGVVAEIYHPGAIAPGIVGAIALLLAFIAFGNLPTNWGAAGLLGLALLLFLLELHLPSHGVLGAGAPYRIRRVLADQTGRPENVASTHGRRRVVHADGLTVDRDRRFFRRRSLVSLAGKGLLRLGRRHGHPDRNHKNPEERSLHIERV